MNRFEIRKAHKAVAVSYRVKDTWDEPSDKFIFQPAGTNFMAGEEFVLNPFAMLGYLDGMTNDRAYTLTIEKPVHLYGATSLDRLEATAERDVFTAANYVELVDQPILYARADTASYFEGGARIGIAVYSPIDTINAQLVREWVRPITKATEFVLGEIPTDEYWFLMHFFDWTDPTFSYGGAAFGALEHQKSSLYFLPTFRSGETVNLESVKSVIDGMATHEFLHILAPLNLHSEEIAYFDFYDTKLSRHLWLYEGVTEYLSMKSLLLGGIKDLAGFAEEVSDKIDGAAGYREMSFTEMSLNIIDPEMQKQYGNVYEKGALLGLALDIRIAELTDGRMDLVDLVLALIRDYGIGKPFRDDELFDVITDRVHPDLREFFSRYIEGAEPLPLKDLLRSAGLEYSVTSGQEALGFGPLGMEFDSGSGLLRIWPEAGNDILPGELMVSRLNGEELSFRLVRNLLTRPATEDPLEITYVEGGEEKTITLVPQSAPGEETRRIAPWKP